MRFSPLAIGFLFVASAAPAMPVSTFLEKADALKSRGALAVFSSDYGLLKNEVVQSMNALRSERLASLKSGTRPAYCPADENRHMSVDEIMAAMNSVPQNERARIGVKDALRAHLEQRYPCSG
jgi:hypothetical protein